MAIMIPLDKESIDYHKSAGEESVYHVLWKKLPDDFIVMHSINWRTTNEYKHEKNGESDFLIFHPEYGFLTVEVKGGGIEKTYNGEWWSTNRYGEKFRLKRSPMEQAWESANHFNSVINNSNNNHAKKYRVRPVVWFTNSHKSEVSRAYGEDFTIGNTFNHDDLKNPERAIERAYYYYNQNRQPINLTDSEKRSIISLFSSEFKIIAKIAISEAERNRIVFNRLTDEQAKLLDYIDKVHAACIEGVGGTGKTMLALERARRIPKDEKVLFLCFNKFLLNTLRKNNSESMPNVTFANLNELYASKTNMGEYAEKDEITAFLKSYFDQGYGFKHIIIDEGQDFEATHLDELSNIAQKLGGYFYIFYDENQLVHQWKKDTIDWFKNCQLPTLQLTINCRNTKSIATTAYRPVEIDKIVLSDDAVGEVPTMEITDSPTEIPQLVSKTIRKYTDKGYSKKQIVILTVKTITKSILANQNSVDGYRLSVDDPDDNNILFTTSRKFKGLESDVVIVIDVDEECFKDDNAKSVFYVATSRAVNELTIIANLSKAGMTKLIDDLQITKTGSSRRLLEEELSVSIVEHFHQTVQPQPQNNQPLPKDNPSFLESINNSNYNQSIKTFLINYYSKQPEKSQTIPQEEIKTWLKKTVVRDNQDSFLTAITETTKWPSASNRFSLELYILFYLETAKGIYAKNILDLLEKVINVKTISSSTKYSLNTFLNNCQKDKIIIVDKIGIGTPNHYIINNAV